MSHRQYATAQDKKQEKIRKRIRKMFKGLLTNKSERDILQNVNDYVMLRPIYGRGGQAKGAQKMESRAVVFTAPRSAVLEKRTVSESGLGEKEFLLRARYSLISAGTETACYRGSEAWFRMPGIPGYSTVGEVLAVGAGVTDLVPGDLVFCRGNHQEVQIYSEKGNYCRLPQGIDLRYAPFARMFAISFTSTRVSGIELGDDVLVVGQGLIGNAAAQLAQLQGANVAVMDLSEERLELARRCGIRHTLNSGAAADMTEAVRGCFDGRKPAVVIDATGVPAVIDKAIDYVAVGGKMILLGSPRGIFSADVGHFQAHIHKFPFRVSVTGAHEQTYPAKADPYVKHSCERNERICLELIRDGRLAVEPLLTHVIAPEEAPEIYARLDKGDASLVGVIYDWSRD